MSSAPTTIAVILVTVDRETAMSGSSVFEELFKVEYQHLGDSDSAEASPMLFQYNNGGYAYLETLPAENPVMEARNRIEDYILDAELVDVEVKPRTGGTESGGE